MLIIDCGVFMYGKCDCDYCGYCDCDYCNCGVWGLLIVVCVFVIEIYYFNVKEIIIDKM